MAKVFSVVSWNVKHFKKDTDPAKSNKDKARVKRVVELLKQQDPDIFGLYEVTGKEVFGEMTKQMPGYTFQITEGPQTQEILVGVKSNLTCFMTQRVEFKAGVTLMRPGLLATLTIHGVNYCLLFLHVASGTIPRGMGLRDDMLQRAFKFKKSLEKVAPKKEVARYMFLGDLNNMGLKYPYKKSIDAEIELKNWDAKAVNKSCGMHRLKKTYESTWSGGSKSTIPDSNLDHVFVSDNLKFKTFKNDQGEVVDVDVRGWVNIPSKASKDKWLEDYSDHSMLYFEVI